MVDMIRYYDHLMDLMSTNAELKKSATGIMKQTLWSAGGTIAGGAVGGPAGALAGGLLGAAFGYLTSDDYQAMLTVLQDLSDEEKAEIVCKVRRAVGSELLGELTSWIALSSSIPTLLEILKPFISK
ncbi:uncharacterized protein LOC144446240 [Glandiceps talaboti]